RGDRPVWRTAERYFAARPAAARAGRRRYSPPR
ncbi:hypothetical protein AZ044_001204, partial [Pluralibacter gergoviae]